MRAIGSLWKVTGEQRAAHGGLGIGPVSRDLAESGFSGPQLKALSRGAAAPASAPSTFLTYRLSLRVSSRSPSPLPLQHLQADRSLPGTLSSSLTLSPGSSPALKVLHVPRPLGCFLPCDWLLSWHALCFASLSFLSRVQPP